MKKTMIIMIALILTMTLLMGIISCYADINTEAKSLKNTIVKSLKEIGVSVMIIVIAIIGFGMLFGGGGDITKYKMHFLILLVGAILIFKADTIGDWVYKMLD